MVAEAEEIPSGLGQACLSEIMTKNKATLRDPDGDFSDWIEIRNTAGRAINLEGWSLSKNGGKSVWIFPSFPLDENGYVIVYAAKKEHAGTVLCTGFALSDGDMQAIRSLNKEQRFFNMDYKQAEQFMLNWKIED